MSRQSSELPDEPEVPVRGPGKKRKGEWELWEKWTPPWRAQAAAAGAYKPSWCRVGRYERLEQALLRIRKRWRELPGVPCEYEIRHGGERLMVTPENIDSISN